MVDDLNNFVVVDLDLKIAEAEVDRLKYERRRIEERLLEHFAMNAKNNATVETSDGPYRVYIRHTSGVRVANEHLALGSLRQLGLGAFIDESVDTGRLGSFYKKNSDAKLPEGLELFDNFKMFVVRKKV